MMQAISFEKDTIGVKSAASFRKSLKDAAGVKNNFDISFCSLIWKAKTTIVSTSNGSISFYEYCKYNSWENFVQKELNLTAKTANRYSKVYQAFAINLGKKDIAKKHILPISKMIALAPYINKDNVDNLVDISRDISSEEFKQLTLNPEYKHHLEKNDFVTFLLNKGDRKFIDRAMKKASKEFGDLPNGELIIKIIKAWLKS